ncbi:MAG: hypothetical protein AB7S68_28955 [Polyangiaceae bacterium]
MNKRFWGTGLLAVSLAASSLGGCAYGAPEEFDDESVAETQSEELSVWDWTPLHDVGSDHQKSWLGGGLATLNGTTYMVHSGSCPPEYCNQLWWTKRNADGTWTNDIQVPNQLSGKKVSLAAFNGYVYMVHSGSSAGSQDLWLSRFNPSTQQWSPNYKLSYTSYETPALQEYNGRLYMIGSRNDGQLWVVSMNSSESWGSQQYLSGQFTTGRVSAAVFRGRLYRAHRDSSTTYTVLSSFDGTSWTAKQYLQDGAGGWVTNDPAIATSNGYLHMLYRKSDLTVNWMYFDGSSWSTTVSLGNEKSYAVPSLVAGGPGLIRSTVQEVGSFFTYHYARVSEFDSPTTVPGGPIENGPLENAPIGFKK